MISIADMLTLTTCWASKRRNLATFAIFVEGSAGEADDVISRLANALNLIERYDPDQRAHVGRTTRRFLLVDASVSAYRARIELIQLGMQYTLNAEPIELAMRIVRLAAHADSPVVGRHISVTERGRIEHGCHEAAVAFAERVPGSDNAIQEAHHLLATEWWDLEKHAERTIKELTRQGLPKWIARQLALRFAKRSRRQ